MATTQTQLNDEVADATTRWLHSGLQQLGALTVSTQTFFVSTPSRDPGVKELGFKEPGVK